VGAVRGRPSLTPYTTRQRPDINRVQMIFNGQPTPRERDILTAHGWRWSRTEGAWQRHLNPAGLLSAKTVAGILERMKP